MATRAKLDIVVRYMTIIPAAHVRAWDLPLQRRLYALFHTTNVSRILHSICTPIIVWFMLVALSYVPLPFVGELGAAPQLSLLAVATFAAYAFAHDVLAGALLLPVQAGLWITASEFAARSGPEGLGIAVAGMLIASAVQTFSHFWEPVPPPLSGDEHFLPFVTFWRTASPMRKLLALFLGSTVYVLLELIAAPRVFPCQALRMLQWLGYAVGSREETERAARRMMERWHEQWSE
ncbi:hypothetical protein [Polyangium aurulentum]|uniref:hypothetical protein n=1 Tax=Polyangium aurulentum TaxID=2567896 RepID=UPI0010ADD395|nr:hypothetical protein [Polyangium aurulentum]UQA61128.1 hypothetical protein E8A73_011870 [Polyangium aurulentum]